MIVIYCSREMIKMITIQMLNCYDCYHFYDAGDDNKYMNKKIYISQN